ncbi:MAG: hypothetical protein RSD57_05710 [Comamonas sp.]
MHLKTLMHASAVALLIPALSACSSWMPFKSKKEAEPAPIAGAAPAPSTPSPPKAPAATTAAISPANLHGVWECNFQIKMGEDSASFTYTNQFNDDGTVKSQAYLVYNMPSTQQQYAFVVQGSGHWRLVGNAVTLIVPDVVKQDRSTHKNPDMVKDKDLVPEDLSDTWTVQAHQGKNMRVVVGSLADEMLCQKE